MIKPHLLSRADLRCPNCKSSPEVIRMNDSNVDDYWWEERGVTYPVLIRHTVIAGRTCSLKAEIYHLTLRQAISVWKEYIQEWKTKK